MYYTYDGMGVVARRQDTGDPMYLHKDILGSITAVADNNATVQGEYEYYPFGELVGSASNLGNWRFTGQEWDNDITIHHFPARYYEPRWGRFVTPDPFGGYLELPQSQNRYAYCMNNPVKYIDPLGLWPWDDFMGYFDDEGWHSLDVPADVCTADWYYGCVGSSDDGEGGNIGLDRGVGYVPGMISDPIAEGARLRPISQPLPTEKQIQAAITSQGYLGGGWFPGYRALWGLSPEGVLYNLKGLREWYLEDSPAGETRRFIGSCIDFIPYVPLDYFVWEGTLADIEYKSDQLTDFEKGHCKTLATIGLGLGVLQIYPPAMLSATLGEAVIFIGVNSILSVPSENRP